MKRTLTVLPLLFACCVFFDLFNVLAAAAQGPMLVTTTSRYMSTLDANTLAMEGCNQGTASPSGESNYVILDFGEPWWDSNLGGEVYAFDNNTYLDSSVASAVEAYADGVIACSDRKSGDLIIIIGTNNYGPYVTNSNGNAWGSMALSAGVAISSLCRLCGQENLFVNAYAGSDMELAYNSYPTTSQWVSGERQGGAVLTDYGDANGCPPAGSCYSGWTQQEISQLADRYIPEIYYSVNANQWANIAQTACSGDFYVLGPLTEYAADGSTNTPQQAWNELWDALAPTCGSTDLPLQASTDITWIN